MGNVWHPCHIRVSNGMFKSNLRQSWMLIMFTRPLHCFPVFQDGPANQNLNGWSSYVVLPAGWPVFAAVRWWPALHDQKYLKSHGSTSCLHSVQHAGLQSHRL